MCGKFVGLSFVISSVSFIPGDPIVPGKGTGQCLPKRFNKSLTPE